MASAVPQSPAASSSSPDVPHFDDKPHGLESLASRMFELEKAGDASGLQAYARSLELTDSKAWFITVFGDDVGADFSQAYESLRPQIPVLLSHTIADPVQRNLDKPTAVKLEDVCDLRATPQEYALLLSRKAQEPIYVLRFIRNGQMVEIPFFAYVDGGFRYIGNIRAGNVDPEARAATSPGPASDHGNKVPEQVRIGGNVMQQQAVCQYAPMYPESAKAEHIDGKVVLRAIIDKDGCVKELTVVSGDDMLTKSALRAVRQWRYRPTMLRGRPIQVVTTITVIFNLR